jgi:hypothetical protein
VRNSGAYVWKLSMSWREEELGRGEARVLGILGAVLMPQAISQGYCTDFKVCRVA